MTFTTTITSNLWDFGVLALILFFLGSLLGTALHTAADTVFATGSIFNKVGFLRRMREIPYRRRMAVETTAGIMAVTIGYIGAFGYIEPQMTLLAVLVFTLWLINAVMDHETMYVNDTFAGLLMTSSIVYGYFSGNIDYAYLGGVVAGLLFIVYIYSPLRKIEMMGTGDVMPLIAGAAMLGMEAGLISIFLMSVFGIIGFIYKAATKSENPEMPLLPAMAAGVFCGWIVTIFFQGILVG